MPNKVLWMMLGRHFPLYWNKTLNGRGVDGSLASACLSFISDEIEEGVNMCLRWFIDDCIVLDKLNIEVF